MYRQCFFRALAFAMLALGITACDDVTDPAKTDPADEGAFAGSYVLKTIDGSALPVEIEDGWSDGCDARINSASVELKADRTFASSIAGDAIPGHGDCGGEAGPFTDSQSGAIQIEDAMVFFDGELFEDTAVVPGSLSGDVLVVTYTGDGGNVFRFER